MTGEEFSYSPEELKPTRFSDLLTMAIEFKFKWNSHLIGTLQSATGQEFDTLRLTTAYLKREKLPDGSHGIPVIEYPEFRDIDAYIMVKWDECIMPANNGRWVYVFGDEAMGDLHNAGDEVEPYVIGELFTKIIAGQPFL